MSDLRIHAALSPRVAVLSSPDVDRVVQLNGIPDLPTLLRPFEFSVERLSVRTSQLETRICDQFPLRFDPYALFNSDAARAISSSQSQGAPRPSAVGQSHEELLDRVNHLIASNIKKWDAQVPRTVSANWQSQPPNKQEENNDDREGDRRQALDKTLVELQRGSLEQIAPWFAAVQQLVFGQRSIAKHESFGHPVAVLLAVSSASPDPMNDFAKLYEASSQASPFPAHPYINPDTLKYYVLIHDVRSSGEDLAGSKEILEQIKKTYGLHCCLLAINSASSELTAAPAELAALWSPYLPSTPTSPVIPSPSATPSVDPSVAKLLDLEDVKRIKGFIRELTAQSIVPFMERYVQHMGDHLANSRKGLTNRFFGASRKLFGGVTVGGSSADKSGSAAPTGIATSGGYDPQHEFYPHTSIEAQTRRLADFAFTIRDYKLAAAMYDLGRKDFAGDKASRHAAGATEMFGLSHLMIMYTSRSAPIDVDSYLSQACYEYDVRSSSRGHVPASVEENHALRATLLYYEAYRMLGYLRPAPAGLLRMSQRSEEVLAPLLLEQAALSCLQMRPKPSLRKFALYLVTAAHRYQACGQKILSLRCYAQAAVVYRAKGWALIENHIEHELGMQAYNEGDSDAAVAHLIRLIRPSANSSVEHERFLQDVQTAYKYSGQAEGDAKEGKVLALPFAMFDVASAALRFVPESSASATSTVDDAVWETLEQDLVDHGLGERTLADGTKRRRKRPTGQTSTQARQVPINQTFWLDVEVHNPLGIGLTIDEIRPLLSVDDSSTQSGAQDLPDVDFEIDDAGRITLAPFQSRRVRVALRVKTETKNLRVASITFRLEDTIHFNQRLDKKGQRLNKTKEQRTSVVYGPDLSLAVSVHGARPTLTARVVDVPRQMYCGEEVRLKVVLKNEGEGEVEDLRALCDQPEAAGFVVQSCAVGGADGELTLPDHLGPAAPRYLIDTDGRKSLSPGEEYEATLVVRPVRTGELRLAWLLSFSSADGETYLSRMALHTSVSVALQISISTRPTRDAKCEHEVWVEASNMLSTEEMRLEGITMLSPSWKIVGEEAEEEVVIAPLQVWRGRARIAFESKQGKGEEYTPTKLQDLLLSRDVRRPPPVDTTIHRSTHRFSSTAPSHPVETSIYVEARKLFRQRTLSLAFPTIASRDRTACFTLFPVRTLDVMLSFSIGSRRGSVPVYDLSPGPSRSVIREITHPSTVKEGNQVRSLYAETLREKASVMQNIVSGLGREDDPVVVGVEVKAEKVEFTVRNFSDLYEVQVEIQLDGQGWVGRRTRRCRLLPGCVERVYGEWRGRVEDVRYTVVSESYIGGRGTDKEGERVLVGRWVERY
ncbi:Trafficking protein particle complex III-specific subunit 85 [Pseudozyma hubeiensis]|nr:Trafficking protein particle complex III-specific subunit 85 [Pseudozyma hubeiensis]